MTDIVEGFAVALILILFVISLIVLISIIGLTVYWQRSTRSREERSGIVRQEMPIGINALLNIIFKPDLFFRQVTESRLNLLRPLFFIIIGELILCISYWSYIALFIQQTILSRLLIGLVTCPPIVDILFLILLIISILFFVLTVLFKGTGSFPVMLQNVGYGMGFFLFLSGLIFAVGSLLFRTLESVSIDQVPIIPDPTTTLFFTGVFLPLVWAAILWSYGLKHARNISLPQAAISVTVVVILGLWLTYGRYLLYLLTQ
jgi:hypothetical protein